ncbi:MAG TPA: hypothetical protein VK195_07610 [Burkholderiaceae bacterium]|nr:hypothetical protein [Burkholderiaceae bacterium]
MAQLIKPRGASLPETGMARMAALGRSAMNAIARPLNIVGASKIDGLEVQDSTLEEWEQCQSQFEDKFRHGVSDYLR